MLKWCYIFLVSGVLISCSNSIDIEADFKEQMFVYALLDASDSTHYIRIQKTFMQSGVSPYDIIGDYQNIYYAPGEISVSVEEWKDNTLQQTWDLEMVNGDTIAIVKNTGLFAASPNILYRFKAPLDQQAQYKLKAVNNYTGVVTSAQTDIVDSFAALFPTASLQGFDFTDTARMYYICRYAVDAKLYDLQMRMYFRQEDVMSGAIIDTFIDWTIFKNIIGDNFTGSGIVAYGINANAFYSFVASVLDPEPGVIREFQKINYTFFAGGEALYRQYLNLMANSGITSQYAYSVYTNVYNGHGIFSSIYSNALSDMYISAKSVDTLACGRVTGDLGFKSAPSNPAYPGCGE